MEDEGGQTASAQATVEVVGPPEVACVPWRYNLPHDTWSGHTTTLKGAVKHIQLPLDYTWDFGDGSASQSGTITTEKAKYEIEAAHTYQGAVGTPYVATLTVTDPSGRSGSDQYHVIIRERTLDVETNVATDNGLWYLHKQIQRLRQRWSTGRQMDRGRL